MEAKNTPVGELSEYGRNPRRGDVAAIRASMKRLGQYKPIVVNTGTLTGRPNEILAGNHTFRAACQLGNATVRTVWVDVDEDTARGIVLADNRTGDLATYDPEKLLEILSALPDLDATGYSKADAKALGIIPETPAQTGKASEGVNLFSQRKDWEERGTRGMLMDYDVETYWEVRDLFDAAAIKAGTKTPAETFLFIIEQTTGEQAPRA